MAASLFLGTQNTVLAVTSLHFWAVRLVPVASSVVSSVHSTQRFRSPGQNTLTVSEEESLLDSSYRTRVLLRSATVEEKAKQAGGRLAQERRTYVPFWLAAAWPTCLLASRLLATPPVGWLVS